LAFLAPRARCWLMVDLSSPSSPSHPPAHPVGDVPVHGRGLNWVVLEGPFPPKPFHGSATERPVPKFSASLFLLISAASCRSCRACWAISSLATLEVMMKMASLQSMVVPFPSVSRPCSNTAPTPAASAGAAGHAQTAGRKDTRPVSRDLFRKGRPGRSSTSSYQTHAGTLQKSYFS